MPRYIDADALVQMLENDAKHMEDTTGRMWTYAAINDIKNAPTADVSDRKVGKWIYGWTSGYDGTRHWFRVCSECGSERNDDDPEKDTNFCPHCGADMRERREDEIH